MKIKTVVGVLAVGAVLASAGAAQAASPPEAYPIDSDEAFDCFLQGTDQAPVVYEATTLANEGYIRSLGPTGADDGWLKAFGVRIYDNTEYTLENPVEAPPGTPTTVYVSGRQMIMLEWATPQTPGSPTDDPIAVTWTVPNIEVRDADGALVDAFSYRVVADVDTGLNVVHQNGVCGDFVIH